MEMSENAGLCSGVAARAEMVSCFCLLGIVNLDGPVHAIVTGNRLDAAASIYPLH